MPQAIAVTSDVSMSHTNLSPEIIASVTTSSSFQSMIERRSRRGKQPPCMDEGLCVVKYQR